MYEDSIKTITLLFCPVLNGTEEMKVIPDGSIIYYINISYYLTIMEIIY